MRDQFLIDLAPGWALGFDNLQWVLGKTVKTPLQAVKTALGVQLRPLAFIGSTKAVFLRVASENEIQLSPEAVEYIEAMPDTFRVWYRRHRLQVVPEQAAA